MLRIVQTLENTAIDERIRLIGHNFLTTDAFLGGPKMGKRSSIQRMFPLHSSTFLVNVCIGAITLTGTTITTVMDRSGSGCAPAFGFKFVPMESTLVIRLRL